MSLIRIDVIRQWIEWNWDQIDRWIWICQWNVIVDNQKIINVKSKVVRWKRDNCSANCAAQVWWMRTETAAMSQVIHSEEEGRISLSGSHCKAAPSPFHNLPPPTSHLTPLPCHRRLNAFIHQFIHSNFSIHFSFFLSNFQIVLLEWGSIPLSKAKPETRDG